MIKLIKDNRVFEVRTQVQASAFIKSGWKVVIEEKKANVVVENKVEPKVEPKRTTSKARVKK